MLHLDPITAYALVGAGALVGATMIPLIDVEDPEAAPSLHSFAAGFLVFGIGLFPLIFDDPQPSSWSMLWAMNSIVLGASFFARGFAQLQGYKVSARLFWAWCLACVLAVSASQQLGPRVFISTVGVLSFVIGSAVTVMQRRLLLQPQERAERALAIAVLLYTGSWALRFVLGLVHPEPLQAHLFLMPDGLILWFGVFYSILPLLLASLILNLFNARLRARLRAMAFTDDLTGLLTRRALHDFAPSIAARASRLGAFTAVLMVDLDHFKRINDEHGHAVGDAVLAAAAQACRQSLRGDSLVARYGGEELVGLMVVDDAASALAAAERTREAVQSSSVVVACGNRTGVTASVGVALWMPGQTLEQALACADLALYRAKADGRNRVQLHAA